jgi:hypothetical protein
MLDDSRGAPSSTWFELSEFAQGISVRSLGATGDGRTDDAPAFQRALTVAAGGTLIVPATAASYMIGSPLIVPANSDIVIQSGATIRMSKRLESLFHAEKKSHIRVHGKGKIRGTNTSIGPTAAERLLFFERCDDVIVTEVDLAETVIACQFWGCTNWQFNASCHDILHRADKSEGYGVLANTDNSNWRIGGKFTNIGRHAIYVTSGSSNGTIKDATIDGCDSVGIDVNCYVNQNVCNNIAIDNVAIRNVGRGSALPNRNGIALFGNVSNIAIGSGVTIENCDDDGIHIEGVATFPVSKNPHTIRIASPTIKNVRGKGIVAINVIDLTMDQPIIRATGASAIHVAASGQGPGAVTKAVNIKSYDIDGTATYGITVGETIPGAATDITLGSGVMRNARKAPFNISTAKPPRKF